MTGFLLTLRHHDERLLLLILARRHRLLDSAVRAVTHIADPIPAVGVSLTLTLLPASAGAGRTGLLGLIVSHVWVQIFKRACCRQRPSLPIGTASLMNAPDRFSFPSGHAAAAASMAFTLALAVPALAWLAAGIAAIVGLSRCYLGLHYPGDVVVGWLLAWLAFVLVSFFTFV